MKSTRAMQRIIDHLKAGGTVEWPYRSKSFLLFHPDRPHWQGRVSETVINSMFEANLIAAAHRNAEITLVE